LASMVALGRGELTATGWAVDASAERLAARVTLLATCSRLCCLHSPGRGVEVTAALCGLRRARWCGAAHMRGQKSTCLRAAQRRKFGSTRGSKGRSSQSRFFSRGFPRPLKLTPIGARANEPAQGGAFVSGRIGFRQQLAEHESVSQRQSAHLPRGHLGGLKMTAVDRAFKAAVSCPLRRHSDCRWGSGLERA
jgi:hypothetical protein